ncbi:alpha/beta fold hydrolase [Streptomyces sp. NPDC059718]
MNMTPIEPPAQEGSGPKPASHRARRGFSRRAFVGGAAASAAAAAGISLVGGLTPSATAAPSMRRPSGFGSVSTAPMLPAGFTKTFSSRFVRAGGLRQHVVIGGDGPPLLLVHGWPQNWYAWRMVMPALARDFTVVAVDQRGIGLTDKPQDGYDTRTIANDLVALMDALGHRRFAVVGTDTGMPIGYALASDHPDRVAAVALGEVPGPPGARPSPPLFIDDATNNHLWHIPFNRVDSKVTEQLVSGREDIFFGYEFDIQAGSNKLPRYARDYYVRLLSNPESLRGSFEFYRAWGVWSTQNAERAKKKLTMPVLGIGGAEAAGEKVGEAMKPLAEDVQTVSIPGAGHWFAEQAPEATVAALTAFLAPYRASASRR